MGLTEELLFSLPMAQTDRELSKLRPYSRTETEYVGILRGPAARWWKPILAILLAGIIYFFLSTLVTLPIIVQTMMKIEVLSEGSSSGIIAFEELGKRLENSADPFGIATALLSIICFIPAVFLANRVVFGAKPQIIGSVAGHLRWRLLGKYLVAILVPYLLFLLGLPILNGEEIIINPKPTFWISLIVVLLLAPLQAAAEEYAFRGWFFQTFGSWFKNVRVGWLVLAPISAVIFVSMHLASDFYINIQLGIFALVAALLIWRTGGLEAGIAFHAMNNTSLFVLDALSGGASNSSPRMQTGTLLDTLVYLVFLLVIMAILWAVFSYQEKRSQCGRKYHPAPIPIPVWERWENFYTQQTPTNLPI